MTGGHVLAGRVTVLTLIVEKHVCPVSLEKGTFGKTTQKQGLVDAHVPGAQRANDSLMSGCGTGRHQSRAYGAVRLRKLALQALQRSEKRLEGSAAQRLFRRRPLAGCKGTQALAFEHLLRLVGKQHRIAIEGEAQLILVLGPIPGRQQSRRRYALVQRLAHILAIGGQKQMATERRGVPVWAAATA